jgi:hypothetical protein
VIRFKSGPALEAGLHASATYLDLRSCVRGERVERRSVGGVTRGGRNAWPEPQGGGRFSHKTQAHANLIHAAIDEVPDITVAELKARLARQGGGVGVTAPLALLRHPRGHTRKKDGARGRAGPSGHLEATRGLVRGSARSRPRSPRFHLRRMGLEPHGPALRAGSTWTASAGCRASLACVNAPSGARRTSEGSGG